jgi:hypothetical protein
MVPTGKCAIKHYAPTLLVANVSNDRLDNCGIIYYRNDLLGKRCTPCALTPIFHCKKQPNFTVIATTFGNAKS